MFSNAVSSKYLVYCGYEVTKLIYSEHEELLNNVHFNNYETIINELNLSMDPDLVTTWLGLQYFHLKQHHPKISMIQDYGCFNSEDEDVFNLFMTKNNYPQFRDIIISGFEIEAHHHVSFFKTPEFEIMHLHKKEKDEYYHGREIRNVIRKSIKNKNFGDSESDNNNKSLSNDEELIDTTKSQNKGK
jgi:hypothetical protein